ncbi:PKD domain-containing protein [Cellulomonas alba]|uniref:PKD domain-containing protein n=1 Tax=Cellulomonas alba TaxID=3053467 RepID=A0ABT7SHB4_9CELL|nr:PKD domain-containing protein [Cellulomonas alba]MDM7855582.1 PKD domain-containing protein [Cellulomonas alba]
MSTNMIRPRRLVAAVAAAALLTIGFAAPSFADTQPADPSDPTSPATVAADGLPTVQIDGVIWSQVTVGDTVYAAGSFSTARPAGSAAGVNTVARANLLAFNINTGALITNFAPVLDGQARAITASPDGKRIYVTGDFSHVDGVYHVRVAAFDTATNTIVPGFKSTLGSAGLAVAASNTTVYVGGNFKSVASTTGGTLIPHTYLAALDANTGAVTSFSADADAPVTSLAYSPAADKVFVGGRFTQLTSNGTVSSFYGLATVDPATGAGIPLQANTYIRDAGSQSAILSLTAQGPDVFGTGYHFGTGGNTEGVFRIDAASGNLVWDADCHGDGYSSFMTGGVVYLATHQHYCGNIGGFPQPDPWVFHYATAFTYVPTGTNKADIYGYPDHVGQPAPSLLTWYPSFYSGSYTGQNQAGWSVTGNDKYVVFGGEFPGVNGKAQQGLVRFAVSSLAPNKRGPQLNDMYGNPWNVSASSHIQGQVRVSFPTTWDQDNETLTYNVYRGSTNTAPIATKTVTAKFWLPQTQVVVDNNLPLGSSQTYFVTATDPFGNKATAPAVTVTVNSTDTLSSYGSAVYNDGASDWWRLGEPSGSGVDDWAGALPMVANSGVTRGITGAVGGDSNTASHFDGTSNGFAATQTPIPGPNTFSIEAWFRTTTTAGGKIVGFGNANTGTSNNYDRHIYMDTSGKVYFGVYPGSSQTLQTSKAYNDGKWHQVAASLGPNGMQLFVDGARIASRADVTSAQAYSGYWRIGGDSPWSGAAFFNGDIDDVSIYPTPLTRAQVDAHWVAAGNTSTIPPAPADAYGAAVYNAGPDLYWRLGETSGTTAADSGPSSNNGSYKGNVTRNVTSGELVPTGNKGVSFNGNSNNLVSSVNSFTNPSTYSEELWFRTSTTTGGKLVGFGDAQTGTSGSYDRHVYMETGGQLTFGVWTGQANTITTSTAYNDNKWHYLVATQSADGMKLYVDGALQGTNPQTQAQAYTGYWRIGGDTTWGPQPWFRGSIDEFAIYPVALTANQVAAHWAIGTGGVPNQPPVASFTSTTTDLTAHLTSTSTDGDGTVASYLWTFDDGTSSTLQNPDHTFAAAGDHTVTLVVTDDDGATSNPVSHTVTVTAPNQAPTADFTVSKDQLKVTVDGSGSSDPDGNVASYRWTFDGNVSASTGSTASYTFPDTGTYTVTLQVTDDQGATSSVVSKQVSVTAPPPNQAPTASFTVSKTDLKVDVDGSGSNDPDGNVASYQWSFDGTVGGGSAATATHTFDTAGDHTVTLVVTDNQGATSAPVTKTVTLTAPTGPQTYAADAFGRTTASGWGTADTGGAYTLSGSASLFSVNGGVGKMTVNPGSTPKARLDGVSARDVDITTDVAFSALSSGTLRALVAARTNGTTNDYTLSVRVATTGAISLQLLTHVAGVETAVATANVPGVTYAAGQTLNIRFQAQGNGSTALRGRVWTAATEPTTWQITATDSAASLQAAGGVALSAYSPSSTTGAVTASWDDFAVKSSA